MAISRVKTWSDGQVLTASDLNAEFNNILNNPIDLWSPAAKAIDMNGFEIILDADADTSITADTDDRLDVRLSGADLFRFDGTVSTPVNGFDFVASAASSAPRIAAVGSDSNISPVIRAKGTGGLVLQDGNSNEVIIMGAGTASAVNEVTITNAATGNGPVLSATGGDTNVNLELRPKGTGVVYIGNADGRGLALAPYGTSAGNTNELRFLELAANGTHYVGLKAPDSIAGNVIWVLPSADGAANTYLGTNGSGTLSFTALPTYDRVQLTGADFSTTSTTFVDVTSASLTITTKARPARVGVVGTWINSVAGGINYVDVDVDGAKQSAVANGLWSYRENTGNYRSNFSFVQQTAALTAASHTFKIQMRVSANTGTIASSGGDSFFMWVGEV